MPEEYPFEIFPPHEVFYIGSLLFCTGSALMSASFVQSLLDDDKDGQFKFAPQPALNQLQNIVLQGGAISKFFWPVEKRYNERGAILRKAFSISEDNPLKSRRLRNMMEHFDEYLDDYLATVSAGTFFPDYFGHKPSRAGGVPFHIFRAFFADTGEFELLGQIFEIQPIVKEIARIHNVLKSCETGGRFPSL